MTDGQTERLNRCLEHFQIAMASQRPHKWANWLTLAEWWYNSTHNSAIKMSPFEALYEVKPRQMCLDTKSRSHVASVEEFQVQRETMNYQLKEAMQATQSKYKPVH